MRSLILIAHLISCFLFGKMMNSLYLRGSISITQAIILGIIYSCVGVVIIDRITNRIFGRRS